MRRMMAVAMAVVAGVAAAPAPAPADPFPPGPPVPPPLRPYYANANANATRPRRVVIWSGGPRRSASGKLVKVDASRGNGLFKTRAPWLYAPVMDTLEAGFRSYGGDGGDFAAGRGGTVDVRRGHGATGGVFNAAVAWLARNDVFVFVGIWDLSHARRVVADELRVSR